VAQQAYASTASAVAFEFFYFSSAGMIEVDHVRPSSTDTHAAVRR
jgi:hypothetical protein